MPLSNCHDVRLATEQSGGGRNGSAGAVAAAGQIAGIAPAKADGESFNAEQAHECGDVR